VSVRVCVCVYVCVCIRRRQTHHKPRKAGPSVYARVYVRGVCGRKGAEGGKGGGRTSNEDDKGLSGNGRGFRGTAVVGLTVAQGLGFKMPPSAQLPPPPAAASMSASRAIQGIAATR